MIGIYPYPPLFCLWIRRSIDYFILCHLKITVSLLFSNRLLSRVDDFIVQAQGRELPEGKLQTGGTELGTFHHHLLWIFVLFGKGWQKLSHQLHHLCPLSFYAVPWYWTGIKIYVLLLTALGWKGTAILNDINVILVMLNGKGILDFSSLRSISFLQPIMKDGITVRGRAQHWWCLIIKAAFWLAMWPHKWLKPSLCLFYFFNNLGYLFKKKKKKNYLQGW